MGTKVKLVNARLFFNNLFAAEEFKPGDKKPRYSATFGIDKKNKAQLKAIEDAIMASATEAYKGKAAKLVEQYRNDSNKFCFKDGDKVTWDGAEGMMVLAGHRKGSDGRPLLLDQRKNVIADDDGTLYSGCYVNATVDIWAQTGDNQGIRCSLTAIQKAGDGDAFSGASKGSADDFDEVETPGGEDDDMA